MSKTKEIHLDFRQRIIDHYRRRWIKLSRQCQQLSSSIPGQAFPNITFGLREYCSRINWQTTKSSCRQWIFPHEKLGLIWSAAPKEVCGMNISTETVHRELLGMGFHGWAAPARVAHRQPVTFVHIVQIKDNIFVMFTGKMTTQKAGVKCLCSVTTDITEGDRRVPPKGHSIYCHFWTLQPHS